jgi:hypothetical protein
LGLGAQYCRDFDGRRTPARHLDVLANGLEQPLEPILLITVFHVGQEVTGHTDRSPGRVTRGRGPRQHPAGSDEIRDRREPAGRLPIQLSDRLERALEALDIMGADQQQPIPVGGEGHELVTQ